MTGSFRDRQRDASRMYFTQFLPELKGQLLIPGLRSLTCKLGVRVTDVHAGTWTLHIDAGRIQSVTNGIDDACCVFCLEAGTLLEVATGTLPPDRAFFDLRIEIEGDVALGLQLSTVLEPFFKQHPFRLTAL